MRGTWDWDTDEEMRANLDDARAAANRRDLPWELRQSSGGTGWHFIVYDLANDTRQGFQNVLNLRQTWGDDDKRLRLDKKRANAGSPFLQVLYRRKYMERHDWPAEDGTGYSTGNVAEVVEQSDVKAAPERERVKDPDTGRLDYNKMARLLREKYGSAGVLADKMDVSRRTVYRWLSGETDVSKSNRKGLRRKARSQAIGHYAETEDGSGKAADEVRYVDRDDERRTLVEYIDVPWDTNIGEDEREYVLLNIHTGTYNANHSDRQLRGVHDDVTRRAMDELSPTMTTPQGASMSLNLDQQNQQFSVDGWSREPDSINYERELLDDGEQSVYVNNLPNHPEKPSNPENYPMFEIILWDDNMTDMEWHVIGLWTGESVRDATILKDSRGWF